jgi:hypothetical protein
MDFIINYPNYAPPQPFFGIVSETNCLDLVSTKPEMGIPQSACNIICHCFPAFIGDFASFIHKNFFDSPYILQKNLGGIWVDQTNFTNVGIVISNIGSKDLRIAQINFSLVFASFGYGDFRIKVSAGADSIYSYCYQLKQDSCETKDGTVYIKSKLKGNVGDVTDFSKSLSFTSEVNLYARLKGRLVQQTSTLKTDTTYLRTGTTTSLEGLHKASIGYIFLLTLNQIPLFIVNLIAAYFLNDCLITDDNQINTTIAVDLPLKISSIEKYQDIDKFFNKMEFVEFILNPLYNNGTYLNN